MKARTTRKGTRVSAVTETKVHEHVKAYPLTSPGTIHLNHDECGDTRARLYVTLKPNGYYVMWCHNCSKWGMVSKKRGYRIRPDASSDATPKVGDEMRLHMVDLDQPQCPQDAKTYLLKYGFDVTMAMKRGIRWETTTQRLSYPIFESYTGNFIGAQLRDIRNGMESYAPKYLTWQIDQNAQLQQPITYLTKPPKFHKKSEDREQWLVITEDILSSMKLIGPNECGISALPLLGTNLSAQTAVRIIADDYDRILIWLDNDVEEAKEATRKIKMLLDNMGHPYVRVVDGVEPKKLAWGEIQLEFNKHIPQD